VTPPPRTREQIEAAGYYKLRQAFLDATDHDDVMIRMYQAIEDVDKEIADVAKPT
jgi:hypothetical protein